MDYKQDSNVATQQFRDIVMAQGWAERQTWMTLIAYYGQCSNEDITKYKKV